MLDQIFGENNFQNEIVWRRTTAHADTHGFGHVHDIIFRYSNGAKPTFNVELKSYPEEYIEKYFIYEDEYVETRGKTLARDITGAGLRNGERETLEGIRSAKVGIGRHWMRTPSELDELLPTDAFIPAQRRIPDYKRYRQ